MKYKIYSFEKLRILAKKYKFFFILLFTIYYLLVTTATYAATPTVTIKPKTTETEKAEKLIEQINNLKEKVASKVAELRLVEKRGILVVVKEVAGNKITGEDMSGKVRLIDVDELTKFSSPSAKAGFGISDITSNTKISVIGLYNKQSKRILARFITVESEPAFISGIVKEVDKANFIVKVVSEDENVYAIDIENVTKTSTYTETDDIKRAGFSKIQVGQRVYIVGYPVKGQKQRILASRFLIFPDLPANPKIKTSVTEPTEAVPTPTIKAGSTKTPIR